MPVNSDINEDANVCTECVGRERFKQWIADHGNTGACSFDSEHGEENHVVSISAFATEIDSFFRDNYGLGEEYPYFEGESDKPSYETYGEPYEQILAEEIQCDDDIIQALKDYLPDTDAYDGDPFYDDTRNYESLADSQKRENDRYEEYWYDNRFQFQWEEFCEMVQYERRFFEIKDPLDKLFGNPHEYETGDIKPIYLLAAGHKIYRARLLDQEKVKASVATDPAAALAAPPKEKARAGRMNVELIPAFYAAFSDYTAVAEIRPGIGEEVAIAEYALTRELKVFDFTVFDLAHLKEADRPIAHTRYEFISQMQGEISKPILPSDRLREYIPTQIVAEYLKQYFGCEAVIYRSSMIKGHDKESRNIVLLNRGKEFVGSKDAVLTYNKHSKKVIWNLTYQFADDEPF